MKVCWKCGCEKPFTDFYKDRSRGDGVACRCKACAKQQAAAWYANNAEKCAEKHKATYSPKRQPKTDEQRVAERKASLAAYRAANKDRYKKWVADWAKTNRSRRASQVRDYQIRKRNAVPIWANKFFIQQAYELAALRTEMLGFPWHVDHIVPIKSEIVCGLHTHDNLQVIPAAENISKGNRRWPNMPTF